MNNHLIIFAKNPVLGKAKTRLATTIGKEKALLVYKELLVHSCNISSKTSAAKTVFYSDFMEKGDLWSKAGFMQSIQKGSGLGERMTIAFEETLNKNKVIIIGTDCKELNTQILDDAFEQLEHHDFVIGPALDGGYYLLGMKKLEKDLFLDIDWSTSTVFSKTLDVIKNKKSSYYLLPTLSDIDTAEDLKRDRTLMKYL